MATPSIPRNRSMIKIDSIWWNLCELCSKWLSLSLLSALYNRFCLSWVDLKTNCWLLLHFYSLKTNGWLSAGINSILCLSNSKPSIKKRDEWMKLLTLDNTEHSSSHRSFAQLMFCMFIAGKQQQQITTIEGKKTILQTPCWCCACNRFENWLFPLIFRTAWLVCMHAVVLLVHHPRSRLNSYVYLDIILTIRKCMQWQRLNTPRRWIPNWRASSDRAKT